ncbi:hypothetical protein PF008_g27654 [Phytophthora fragariae]|uniref:Uncharacterized protein n=1 Tax=Phytophthora fragariae TaxID=53985 RepID=A0A6G0QDK9_9STRA|nr:hypothetical protein PF008_g27654 [Phytophthora fragariae]
MCPTHAATRPPAATRVPLGDTSGEGDTTGVGGPGDPTADPPVSEGSRASSHTGASPGTEDGDEDDGESEEEAPADHPGSVAHGDSSDVPDDAAILPKAHTVAATDSAGMHALGAMACRFVTEREAKRLDDQKAFPLPDMNSRGDVQAPSRLAFSVDPSTLGRTRLVGVPALQDHQLQGFHIRDGYGGLESLV